MAENFIRLQVLARGVVGFSESDFPTVAAANFAKGNMSAMSEKVCGKCKGEGKRLVSSVEGKFLVSCLSCNGEKVITENLLRRKEIGKQIRELRLKFDFSTRRVAEMLGVKFTFWTDAEQGKIALSDALFLLEQLRTATAKLSIKIEYVLTVTTSPSVWGWKDIFTTKDKGIAEAELAKYQGKLYDGKMAVFEIRKRKTIIELCKQHSE